LIDNACEVHSLFSLGKEDATSAVGEELRRLGTGVKSTVRGSFNSSI